MNNPAGGFIYYNISRSYDTSQTSDTSEFLSFGSDSSANGSPAGSPQFSPSNYSSPRKFHQNNYRSPRGRGARHTPMGKGQFWRKNGGLMSVNKSENENTNRFQRPFHNKHKNGSFHSNTWFEPTCLENPWAKLEKLSVERNEQERQNSTGDDNSQSEPEEPSSLEGSDESSEEISSFS